MPSPPAPKKLPKVDRRAGADRRRVDQGPPGKHERRRTLEARKPEVSEVEMTNSEWNTLADEPIALPPRAK